MKNRIRNYSVPLIAGVGVTKALLLVSQELPGIC